MRRICRAEQGQDTTEIIQFVVRVVAGVQIPQQPLHYSTELFPYKSCRSCSNPTTTTTLYIRVVAAVQIPQKTLHYSTEL